jgi:hypothetical protein
LNTSGLVKIICNFFLRLQLLQVPAKGSGVADQLAGIRFKHDDEAWLVRFNDATIDKLRAQQGLSASGHALNHNHVAPWNSSQEDGSTSHRHWRSSRLFTSIRPSESPQ